jgi:deazaflavin-dependent oxidoreductase (nitroreductase family)
MSSCSMALVIGRRCRSGYGLGMPNLVVDRLAATRTIEITTTGHRSGRPVRIEIWWFRVDDLFVITGTPGPRDWLANLQADPRLTVHALGHSYPATAHPITDRAFRRRFFTQANDEIAWYLSQADVGDLIENAPMIEVRLQP